MDEFPGDNEVTALLNTDKLDAALVRAQRPDVSVDVKARVLLLGDKVIDAAALFRENGMENRALACALLSPEALGTPGFKATPETPDELATLLQNASSSQLHTDLEAKTLLNYLPLTGESLACILAQFNIHILSGIAQSIALSTVQMLALAPLNVEVSSEQFISEMVVARRIRARIDQLRGIVFFTNTPPEHSSKAAEDTYTLVEALEKTILSREQQH